MSEREEPTTPTGQRILAQDYRGNRVYTVDREDILAIEREARERVPDFDRFARSYYHCRDGCASHDYHLRSARQIWADYEAMR